MKNAFNQFDILSAKFHLYSAFLHQELYIFGSYRAEIAPSFNLLEVIYYPHILSRNKLYSKVLAGIVWGFRKY
jgi:hypothetical protein